MVRIEKIFKDSILGKGEIQKDGDHFADCTYLINVDQEIIIIESLSSPQIIPGMFSFSGYVMFNQSELLKPGVLEGMNSGGVFTIHLSDGRVLKTSFKLILETKSPLKEKYRIIPLEQW
jgi:hypothetical protein